MSDRYPSREFIETLEARDIGRLRKVPKGDLHNHMCFGGSREYYESEAGFVVPPLEQKLTSMGKRGCLMKRKRLWR